MQNSSTNNIMNTEWDLSKQTVIDYHHQSTSSTLSSQFPSYSTEPSRHFSYKCPLPYRLQVSNDIPQLYNDFGAKEDERKQFNAKEPLQAPFLQSLSTSNKSGQTNNNGKLPLCGPENYQATVKTNEALFSSKKYDPFTEDKLDDMEISDDENFSQNPSISSKQRQNQTLPISKSVVVTSGAAFYKGLILYIPPFEQIANTYRGSPAMKMLYASFEFSFKMPIRIETKAREDDPSMTDASVYFRNHVLSLGSGGAPQVEACVRALEILSETCYIIQAKEDYFLKCKLVDAETMKTLNLKRWEAVCQKYPKLAEITKESHIQKTFALFLDNHISTGTFEDVICCNLTRQDVNSIKRVVEFFQLTMLPYSVSTSLSKKQTPCVVSIHKYTSAQKLLDILIESGGENEKFKLFPPDTFKDFYKLHQRFWDPALRKIENKNKTDFKTTLADDELQAIILKPYENIISTLFEKYRTMPKVQRLGENCPLRKAGDDFMKETLKIDVADSKNVAPVERMQLLLKYMEQLQEYGSRVLVSGRSEMIKIYHNAIDNLRKDLDACRKDIEKDQKGKTLNANTVQVKEKCASRASNSSRSPSRRRISPKRRSKSPWRKSRRLSPMKRSASPKHNRSLRSSSPRRRPRSKSPRRKPLRTSSHTTSHRKTSSSFTEEPPSQRQNYSVNSLQSADHRSFSSNFEDQFRKYIENLRRFRIEIEDTPLERRSSLKDKLAMFRDQLYKFRVEVSDNPRTLERYVDEMDICKEEIFEQTEMLAKSGSYNNFSESNTLAPWINVRSFDSSNMPVSYPLPESILGYGSQIPPSSMYRQDKPFGFSFPHSSL